MEGRLYFSENTNYAHIIQKAQGFQVECAFPCQKALKVETQKKEFYFVARCIIRLLLKLLGENMNHSGIKSRPLY